MCGPAAIPLLAASALVTAGGAVYSGMAANAQGKYAAAVATENRRMSIRARDDARERGEVEQMRHYRRLAQAMGEQRAQQAASGLDVSFGSALDLQQDIALIGGEDSRIIGQNTEREMRGYEIEAANYTMEGRAARARGKAALVGGIISGVSTILGSASQIQGMNARRAGASIGG